MHDSRLYDMTKNVISKAPHALKDYFYCRDIHNYCLQSRKDIREKYVDKPVRRAIILAGDYVGEGLWQSCRYGSYAFALAGTSFCIAKNLPAEVVFYSSIFIPIEGLLTGLIYRERRLENARLRNDANVSSKKNGSGLEGMISGKTC